MKARVGAQVSRKLPPPLPGGYVVGEQVYYTGASHAFGLEHGGDQLEHGKQGEVVGPATVESHRGKGVAVLFPGNKGASDCYLHQVVPPPPPPPPPPRSHPQLPTAPQLLLLSAHPRYAVCGRTGKP